MLARARALAGDPMGASKAAEAAIVREPHANAPLLAFAEARLDLGHLAPAEKAAARRAGARARPQPARMLLLHRARQAAPGAPAATPAPSKRWSAACRRDGAVSPVVAAGCDLAFATAARAAGKRGARPGARAGRRRPQERASRACSPGPRSLLAQLGRIDEADGLAERSPPAPRSAELPALAWARIAITLGRGELALPPPGLRAHLPRDPPGRRPRRPHRRRPHRPRQAPRRPGPRRPPPTPTCAPVGAHRVGDAGNDARPAAGDRCHISAGGDNRRGAGRSARAARCHASNPRAPPEAKARAAYAQGLRARLAGDAPTAVRWLSAALDGHGDACRAAGEYLAAARLANHPVTTELDRIRAVNTRCQNLALPPPATPAKKPRPPKPARPAAAARPPDPAPPPLRTRRRPEGSERAALSLGSRTEMVRRDRGRVVVVGSVVVVERVFVFEFV